MPREPSSSAGPAALPGAALRVPALAWALLFAAAAALLAIGVTRDWRLLHEDNGALHTTFALSHLRLGLARTAGHDVFFAPRTGASSPYGHHPPGVGLTLAGAFALIGSDAPWVARSVAIAFQLSSLALFVALLRVHFAPALAFLGGAFFAAMPMGAYFGRMVNYESLCLTFVLLQLLGYARFTATGSRGALACLALGILGGTFVDWPALFFAAALGLVELGRAWRGERTALATFAFVAVVALAALALDLAHLAVATGSLEPLLAVLSSDHPRPPLTVGSFLAKQLEFGRRYFGRAALVAVALAAAALASPRSPVAPILQRAAHPAVLQRWLGASGAAALAYLVAAPSWAIVHAYWQFYALPFVATALVLLVATLIERWQAGGRRWLFAALLVVVAVDVAVTSGRTLVKRHTTTEEYALRQTRHLRATTLLPDALRSPPR